MAAPGRTGRATPVEGKVSPGFFERVIQPHLGDRRRDVVVGPHTGVDVGVVRLDRKRVLVCTTDPLYVEPRLGWDRAAWFAFHILASDLTTAGCRPDWGAIDLDVPPETPDRVLETILRVFDRESRKLGAALVTGHTGRYAGCAFPMVGSGTLLAAPGAGGYVTTRRIPADADLLVSRTPALEATGMLATFFPDKIRDRLGRSTLDRAKAFVGQMSTVRDALRASEVGLRQDGVWAMHDATEGGLRTAAWEMAVASGRGLVCDLARAWIDPTVKEVADLFGMDPLDASSEGTLLLATSPGRTEEVRSALERAGAHVSWVGRFQPSRAGMRDRAQVLRPPSRDSYWATVGTEGHRETRPR